MNNWLGSTRRGGLNYATLDRTSPEFLYREARYLDDKEWNNWLDLYAPDAEFWMPAWDDDDKLTQDPQNESFADLVRGQERA